MAKIAVDLNRALQRRAASGAAGHTTPRVLARGDGWSVADVICTCGPEDRRFEEEHTHHSVAIVVAGTFQLRSPYGEGTLVPGSFMLGHHRQVFECGHEYGRGDRCVSFYFDPEFFERATRDAGAARPVFNASHLPPARALAPLAAHVSAGLIGAAAPWDELALRVLGVVAKDAATLARSTRTPLNAAARVTSAVRAIERAPAAVHGVEALARHAGLSPFHFLRTFERVVGVTPHRYVRRTRLRHAAIRLVTQAATVLDIALECGFGDVSNFNRAFRAEFGMAPTDLRRPRHLEHLDNA